MTGNDRTESNARPAPPRGVIFDFGDTLLQEGPVNLEAGATAVLALARGGTECTAPLLAGTLAEVMADLEPRRRSAWIELPRGTVWRLVYEPLGLTFDAPPEEVEWTFWTAATRWALEPGVNAAIAALEGAGLPWGVLSNAMFRGSVVARQLTRSGLTGTPRFVMTSCDYVLRKPHPRLFALAAAKLETPPGALWFVGDSHEADVRGAAGAGLVPLWYRPRGPADDPAPAVRVIRHWDEFPALLRTPP